MDDKTRQWLYEIAKWCGGFVIKRDGKIESVLIWDHETNKPRKKAGAKEAAQ